MKKAFIYCCTVISLIALILSYQPTTTFAVPQTNEPSSYQTLPDDFPQIDVLVEANQTADGYIFLSNFNWQDFPNSAPYLMILDNSGEPVFAQKSTSGGLLIDFKPQPNGQLSYYDWGRDHYVVLDNTYTVVETITAGNGHETDLHELILTEENHAILMIYDSQPMDMSAVIPGGDPNATVVGLVLQELDENRNVIFEWRSWDHFEITDATVDITGAEVDYAHGNSIEVDVDGNWIVSSRHMDEVTKINRQTGAIMWRLGGKNNQFTFTNDELFFHQHDARRLENGNLLLFDNGVMGQSETSRAIEYQLDEVNRMATAVNIYANDANDLFSIAMGSSRRLGNGNTLVGWGSGYPALTEFHADGSKAFELAFDAPLVSYRAYRLPWQGFPTAPPTLIGNAIGEDVKLTFSWNGATDVAEYEIFGGTSPNPTTLLDVMPRQGFETTVLLENMADLTHFRVRPLNQAGQPATYSNNVAINAYQLFIPMVRSHNPAVAAFADSRPAATNWQNNGTEHVFFRGQDGRIHELWFSETTDWRQNNIGQQTEAPLAVGNPSAYVWEENNTQHVVYRDADGQVHELWYRADLGWQHVNLTAVYNAPPAASDPFGYVWEAEQTQHVIYRGANNHIYELWKGATGWQVKDLTAVANAPLATGTPHAYVWVADGSEHVVYRGDDGMIHELWFKRPFGWNHKPIGAETDSVQALGDPVGVAREDAGQQHVFYRGIDGRIHELYANGTWQYRTFSLDNMTVATFSVTVDDLMGSYSLFFQSTSSHLYELYFYDGHYSERLITEGDTDLEIVGGTAVYQNATNTPQLIYLDNAGQLHKRFFDSQTDRWQRQDISQLH